MFLTLSFTKWNTLQEESDGSLRVTEDDFILEEITQEVGKIETQSTWLNTNVLKVYVAYTFTV